MSVAVNQLYLLVIFVASVSCNEGEYYWRPWTPGSPPPDAITARDYRGISYIAEAYVPNYGVFISQIFANQHVVNVSVPVVNKTTFTVASSHSLKVLCTKNLEKLAWYPTNYVYFPDEVATAVVKPVVSGLNVEDHVVYVGKYVDTSSRIVNFGSIVKDNSFHYHKNGKVYTLTYYEVLVIGGRCTSD